MIKARGQVPEHQCPNNGTKFQTVLQNGARVGGCCSRGHTSYNPVFAQTIFAGLAAEAASRASGGVQNGYGQNADDVDDVYSGDEDE